MRFKLSTLLLVVTFLSFAIGLGYQVLLLRRQVAELNAELQRLQGQRPLVVFPRVPAANQPARNSPFRLLNSETIVNPSVEHGMKADELENQRRIQEHLRDRDLPAPAQPRPGFQSRAR
jgi:hypothetical protein